MAAAAVGLVALNMYQGYQEGKAISKANHLNQAAIRAERVRVERQKNDMARRIASARAEEQGIIKASAGASGVTIGGSVIDAIAQVRMNEAQEQIQNRINALDQQTALQLEGRIKSQQAKAARATAVLNAFGSSMQSMAWGASL